MLHTTNGIVLRSIKYGDSSLVATIFTSLYGIQTYMVQGVRSAKSSRNRSGSFQPGTLLELVVYHQPQKNMQRIREFQAAHIYSSIHESVVKNSIMLFSVELLLRLLPEHAPLVALFDFVWEYFVVLDERPVELTANFPLYFAIQCSRILGYELKGNYSKDTPYLNLDEGGYTAHTPAATYAASEEDGAMLNLLLQAEGYEALKKVEMNGAMRLRLVDWYIAFLQRHTQHMGAIKSLSVLRAILHQ